MSSPTRHRPAQKQSGRNSQPRSANQPRANNQPRPKSRRRTNNNDRPARPPVVSALDAALTAAQERPEPEPRTFAQLGLPEAAVRVLNRRGIHQPFAIQARALPDAIAGRDVLARAQTGSGKTLAFGLPMMARLTGDGSARRTLRPRGLVLVPTRELARQVASDLEPVATILGLKIATVFGGAPMGRQIEQLRRGVDIVVATPGRLIDLMERGSVFLDVIEIAVLDEADHMADLGFLPAVTKILDETPSGRQCLLFSATLDRGVDKLVARYLNDPAIHAVAPTPMTAENMQHHVFELSHEDKVPVAARIAGRPARTLFFVRTKHGADRLAKQLVKHGVDAAAIHGNLNQGQRQRALDAFSSGQSRVLVATDVAARGIHVDDVDLVVHFDPPNDHKDYLHRSGRTARAGATGTVVSLIEPAQTRAIAQIHTAASITAETARVTDEHPAVQALANSGEPIVVAPRAVPERKPNHARRPRPRPRPRTR
ncbi:MAG TPA: DEAD/DEAH box helicase [Mycobacteriales bacterium]|nr:DEAD/DEAH box helicase [Mycobacteriales bacterium]